MYSRSVDRGRLRTIRMNYADARYVQKYKTYMTLRHCGPFIFPREQTNILRFSENVYDAFNSDGFFKT